MSIPFVYCSRIPRDSAIHTDADYLLNSLAILNSCSFSEMLQSLINISCRYGLLPDNPACLQRLLQQEGFTEITLESSVSADEAAEIAAKRFNAPALLRSASKHHGKYFALIPAYGDYIAEGEFSPDEEEVFDELWIRQPVFS